MADEGKHLYDAGWDPANETHKQFAAQRDIKVAEKDLSVALRSAEYDVDRRDEIRKSAQDPSLKSIDGRSNWERVSVKAGAKFYAFSTVTEDGRGVKSSYSPYWLSEGQVKRLEQEELIDLKSKEIEAAVLKNRLAIPCSNRVNGLVEAKVSRDHEAVRTTVGPGKDIYSVGDEERTRWMDGGEEQWHPNLNALELDRTINRQKLAERDGQIADYRPFDIHYAPPDRVGPEAPKPVDYQKQRFGAEVEACEKALVESRRKLDYGPSERAEYANRKAEMDRHISAAAKNPALLDEIGDGRLRKSMQDRVAQLQHQHGLQERQPEAQ